MSAHLELVDRLKADILSGELERGRPLRQQELSRRYNISRIPVRDAIAALRGQGWLVAHGKAGAMVPELDWVEAEDLYQMRSMLECQLLKYAMPNITHEQIGRARDVNNRLGCNDLDLIERGRLNWQLHAVLYDAAQRPLLFKTVAAINEQVRRYMGFQYVPLDYQHVSQTEHEQLFRYLEQKKPLEAIELLRNHIEEAGILLVKYLKSTTA
ncbi:GntR family transcriptional regulator [Marinomonas piezotolerans]|uniref:GntR family transcriptional regulator n=1 Tax=Marinomonas piezotolerans TaxID=2213058 RepID=A0A370UEC5_9GAMM|nr:GntR family transcriptional regulator [Marinomonas piezotolerans]RDL46101.1 GntR family transcriptional regulator [Marinomonas piezotolerans]